MHQKQSSQDLIGFSHEKSVGHRYRQCFLFGKIMYKNVNDLFRGASSTEEKLRHDVFWSHRLQRRLLSRRFLILEFAMTSR
jgi:hypothetical protein